MNAEMQSSKSFMMVVGVLGIAAGLVIAWLITRSITGPIRKIITGSARRDQVASASGQVSGASQSLAEGASEQAAAVEETSASLEEMTSMTNQNADHAARRTV
jgi:methyl-accepting chemotaxis protein